MDQAVGVESGQKVRRLHRVNSLHRGHAKQSILNDPNGTL
jgi:hypothetical protein